jgi:hypothetical protein
MSSGASAAKREANKQAADAYYKALKKAKRMDLLKNVDTQGRRKISEQMGDDISARSKSMLRKADKMGRSINKSAVGMNEKIGKYNDRYDRLQAQMASPTGVSKGVDYADNLVAGRDKEFARIDKEIGALRTQAAGMQKTPAMATLQSLNGNAQPAPLSAEERAIAQRIQALQEERDYADRTSRGINNSYRNLDNLELAFNELASLSKEVEGYRPKAGLLSATIGAQSADQKLRESLAGPKQAITLANLPAAVNSNPSNIFTMANNLPQKRFDPENMEKDPNAPVNAVSGYSKQYEALGAKIKQQLERDKRMGGGGIKQQDPTGLLGSELVSANPVQDVIAS